jgi:hypothetical protein
MLEDDGRWMQFVFFCEDGLDKKEICQMTIEIGHLLMISTEFRCQEVNLKGGRNEDL